MSLNIQTNASMPKNQMAFRGGKDKVVDNSLKILDELAIETPRRLRLNELSKTNPEMFKYIMINESLNKVMSSKLELLKAFFKSIFKTK